MAHKDYIPGTDAGVLSFGTNMSGLITANPTSYGLVAADATALAALVTAYQTALAEATEPTTRTTPKVVAKDVARAQLVASLRSLARRIQANPAVTSEQRSALGLRIYDREPSPIPPPVTMPLVNVVMVRHGSHIIRLADETTPASRAKPEGVDGAEVYTFVGDAPPADLSQWELKGLTTRTQFEVEFTPEDAGKQAHIRARWYNPRGQSGPASVPVVDRVAA